MFIAKQFNELRQQEHIVKVAPTKEELEQRTIGFTNVTIEETDIEYVFFNNQYMPKDEAEQKQKEARVDEIKKELEEIDAKSIRPLRDGDEEYLAKYREQAEKLREELRGLLNGN